MVLDNYNEGDVIKDFFICIDKIKKITKYGDMYLDISLRNKGGVVKGKVWENADYFSEKFEVGWTYETIIDKEAFIDYLVPMFIPRLGSYI